MSMSPRFFEHFLCSLSMPIEFFVLIFFSAASCCQGWRRNQTTGELSTNGTQTSLNPSVKLKEILIDLALFLKHNLFVS